MSLSEKDRKFRPRTGNGFPKGPSDGDNTFVEAVARALRAEFGESAGAVKTVARLTGMNDRTVKNWFAAINGPGGEALISLVRHSNGVCETILRMAGRSELVLAVGLVEVHEAMRTLVTTMDGLIPPTPPEPG